MTRAVGRARLAVASAALAITIAVPAGARAVGGPADARAATVGNAPAVTDAATRPPALREVGIDQRLGEQVPLDLAFRDETGQPVTLRDFVHDKPVVLTLVYYECPMLCTLVLNGLVRAMNVLAFDAGKEFEIVTVSFDPHDRPELARKKKATYLDEYRRAGAAGGWHFLTGDQPEIERLARAVGYRYTYLPEEKQFAHAAAIMVLTPDGKLARYFYGVEYSPRDLRLGLVEAADRRIGNPVDQLLLYCYAYDPATGTYGAVAMRLIRLGGVATLLALGGFIVVMRRRERVEERARANASVTTARDGATDPSGGPASAGRDTGIAAEPPERRV